MTDTSKLYDIFISYSRKDTEVMQKIRDEFIANGIRVWTDEIYLSLGTENWLKEIKKAIQNSRGMVVICSPSSEQSEYVGIEITLAKENKLVFFPYWIEGENATNSIPTLLTTHQWLDARSDNFGKIVELVKSVKKKLNISDVKPQTMPAPKPQPVPQSIFTPKPEEQPKPITPPQPTPAPKLREKPISTLTIQKLTVINPYNWLVLLWWMLVTPNKIKTYKKQYGYKKRIGMITYNYSGLEPVGNWLLSTLLWLPFAISLGLAPIANLEIASHTPPILLGIVIALWLGMGFSGEQLDNLSNSIFWFVVVGVGVGGISFGIGAGIIAFFTIIYLTHFLNKNDWAMNIFGKVALVVLPASYAFLIWVYYFGGWRVFMPATS